MESHKLSAEQVAHLLGRPEGPFLNNKAIQIAPSKLTRSLSAFAHSDGGELVIGAAEGARGKFTWHGFKSHEDANGHIQHLEETFPYGGDFVYEFLSADGCSGYLLRITVL